MNESATSLKNPFEHDLLNREPFCRSLERYLLTDNQKAGLALVYRQIEEVVAFQA